MKNIDEQIAKTQAQINQLTNKKKRLISEQNQAYRKRIYHYRRGTDKCYAARR